MIPHRLQRIATGRVVALTMTLWLGCSSAFFAMGPYAALRAEGGGDLLEESFGYGATEAHVRLVALGESGRATYRWFQWLDLANALLASAALTLALAYALGGLLAPAHPLRALVWLPALVGSAELLENTLLLRLLGQFPSLAGGFGDLAGQVTRIKLVIGMVVLPVTLVSLVALAIRAVRRRV